MRLEPDPGFGPDQVLIWARLSHDHSNLNSKVISTPHPHPHSHALALASDAQLIPPDPVTLSRLAPPRLVIRAAPFQIPLSEAGALIQGRQGLNPRPRQTPQPIQARQAGQGQGQGQERH